ncbi:DUF547 domain-containing protein [Winogradskyella sp. PC-19]|uniref:DUF547 domain-containing protein n=1 Tax=unclassified Winogradskyella TaxID=2615021 RepID=UPI000B3CAD71|nr:MULTISPECIES: DUF547 domain-containing protein [unclassified Winogradskyella]ARV10107.1 DUF547 domain-containing protein [Winogradskyella sp. PC-19]RZN83554.1 MAG: DUF547 domain-containing protein [Winogradskyella sp.]
MKTYILIIIALIGTNVQSQSLDKFFSQADAFFKTNVKNGKVAYAEIHKNQTTLDALLEIAQDVSVSKNDANNYQAFWINAYNLSVIKGVIDNYPTKSPLDDADFFDKTTYSLAGKNITLNDIEHKLLRPVFKDPRFHFVLVCGANGCPPLINKAYLPATLDAQLEEQTVKAINGSFLKVNIKKKRVSASKIMEWYKEDFTMHGKTEIDFINKYRTEKIPVKSKLSYFEYNWNLNKQ